MLWNVWIAGAHRIPSKGARNTGRIEQQFATDYFEAIRNKLH